MAVNLRRSKRLATRNINEKTAEKAILRDTILDDASGDTNPGELTSIVAKAKRKQLPGSVSAGASITKTAKKKKSNARATKDSSKHEDTSTEPRSLHDEAVPRDVKSSKNDADITVDKKELKVGDQLLQDIKLRNQDNEELDLNEIIDNTEVVVIFAYPKANTPGCTRQACGYRDNYSKLNDNSKVFGISADSVKSQKSFQVKHNLPFDLLSDPERKLIGLLGGKKAPASGIIRSHWVFHNGKLKYKNVKVSPEASVSTGLEQVLLLTNQN